MTAPVTPRRFDAHGRPRHQLHQQSGAAIGIAIRDAGHVRSVGGLARGGHRSPTSAGGMSRVGSRVRGRTGVQNEDPSRTRRTLRTSHEVARDPGGRIGVDADNLAP